MTHSEIIDIRHVCIQQAGRSILENVSLSLHAGEFVAVIGPNGAGKSTLIRALSGEWKASGEIRLFGCLLKNWDRTALARRVAIMSQVSRLEFGFTVEQVVTMGRLPHRAVTASVNQARVDAVLEALGLNAVAKRVFTTLSGGERQRVQFARALAQIEGNTETSLLLLDEPTSALDLAQQKSVLDLAKKRTLYNTGVLAVMHDLNLAARYADRVVILAQGALAVDTNPDSALTHELLRMTFGVDAAIEKAKCDNKLMIILKT